MNKFIILPGIIFLCIACESIEANNTTNPAPTNTNASNRVLALGKLVPEGDVIKISVVNARDSRVNQLLVKEGDLVKANQVIAILQGRDRAEQQLRDARANVAIKRAELLKIQQGDVKQAEITELDYTTSTLTAQLAKENANGFIPGFIASIGIYQLLVILTRIPLTINKTQGYCVLARGRT